MHVRLWSVVALLVALGGCDVGHRREVASVPRYQAAPSPGPTPARMRFTATAYSIEGKTASGAETREGIVAADPAVLPLGTRIRVKGAGQYSGEYVVKDTGREIDGREIDLYIADDGEAKRFGKRPVTVEVLHHGGAR
jgi:3D (Asp-Asp-Asp) domain-containing protein